MSLPPFPSPFPELVLRRVFEFLPWQNRIKLETTSRQCYRLLRQSKCILPVQKGIKLEIVCVDKMRGAEREVVYIKPSPTPDFVHVYLYSDNIDHLLQSFDRLAKQIPLGQLEIVSLPKLETKLVESIGKLCSGIRELIICSTAPMQNDSNRESWEILWQRLWKIEKVHFSNLNSIKCTTDDVLEWIVKNKQLKELRIMRCSPSVTDTSLISLSKNSAKLVLLDLVAAKKITADGAAAILNAIKPNGSLPYKDVTFRQCNIDKGQLERKIINGF